eukprot:14269052-Ditylum_brightwellii.AAC.2
MAPIVPEEDHEHVPLKYNVDLNTEQEAFTVMMKTTLKQFYGCTIVQKTTYEFKSYKKGDPCPIFL